MPTIVIAYGEAASTIEITPHTAWYSVQAQRDVATRAAEDVRRVLAGDMPRSPVNQPAPFGAGQAAKETAR